MLFPLDPSTPQCEVFVVLNGELLFFLESSVAATTFDEGLFSEYQYDGQTFRSACWGNEPTREKFLALWSELPSEINERRDFFELIRNAQDIACYFNNAALLVPELPGENMVRAFKSLTNHLFTRSRELIGVKNQSGSSIGQHFQEYRIANQNTQLCFLCGTAVLSQDKSGVEANEQWRADYDHILCQDKYPIYSAHPGNFIPTCHFCNSKAKNAKNMLCCVSDNRRTAFYPLPPANESCYQYAAVTLNFRSLADLIYIDWQDPTCSAEVSFLTAPTETRPKIDVWEEVYDVPKRVEAHIVENFCVGVSCNLMPRDFNDFCDQLDRFTLTEPQNYKTIEWRFWWQKVYEYLKTLENEELNDVWSLIQWNLQHTPDADMQSTFGL